VARAEGPAAPWGKDTAGPWDVAVARCENPVVESLLGWPLGSHLLLIGQWAAEEGPVGEKFAAGV
jgi:hypothetical protein